jgi:PAS domain S-box-containing protein
MMSHPQQTGKQVPLGPDSKRLHIESQNRFQSLLLNVVREAVIATDVQGQITFWNHFAETLYGWKADEITGHNIMEVIPTWDLQAQSAESVTCLQRGESWSREQHVRRRDGTEVWVDVLYSPVVDGNGQLTGMIGVSHDITAQRHAVETLHQSEEVYRALFEQSRVGKAEIDIQTGQLLRVNRKLSEITGYTAEELLGMSYIHLLHPDDVPDATIAAMAQAFATIQDDYVAEKRIIDKNGHIRWTETNVGIVRRISGQPLFALASVQDITERKRSADRVERLQRVTAALSKSVTPHEVAQVIMRESMGALDGAAGAIHVLTEDGDTLEILHSMGYSNDTMARYGRLPITEPVPSAVVARTGHPMWFETHNDLTAQYPFLPDGAHGLGQRGGAIVPLIAEDRTIGVMVLIFKESHPLQTLDRDFLLSLADLCAQALERASMFEYEQRARAAAVSAAQTSAFLAETSQLLSVTLDFESRLDRIAQQAVPFIADMSIVALFELDESVSVVKAAHVQPEKAAWITERVKHTRQTDNGARELLLQVLRTGQSIFFPQVSDAQFDALAGDNAVVRCSWQESGVTSLIIVPLTAYGRVFGAVMLAITQSKRCYSREDLAVAEEWARRVALPVDNARLHRSLQELNAELELRVVQRTVELKASRNQLRNLAARLQAAREEERKRIAREVHDVIGQLLTGIKMDVSSLGEQLTEENSPSLSAINDINDLLDSAIKSVRKVATELRPSILDDMGLVAAVEWHVREFAERSGITCDFMCASDKIPMDNEKATAIFRLVQEAMTNVARHAQASAMRVEMHENNGFLFVEVRDNGRGITDQELGGATSLGLLGMRERMVLLAGQLEIRGVPGKGTTVSAQIPLATAV